MISTDQAKKEVKYKKALFDFEMECILAAMEFDKKCSFVELLKNGNEASDAKMMIQEFLDNALKKLLPTLESKISGKIDCGMISVVDVNRSWSEHHGLLTYTFYVNKNKWVNRFRGGDINEKAEEVSWKEVKDNILAGHYKIGNRYLSESSFGSILLSPTRLGEISKLEDELGREKYSPCLIAAAGSSAGAESKDEEAKATQKKNIKWSLINNENPDDFPQMITLISNDKKPLGFFQLKLSKAAVKNLAPRDVCGVFLFIDARFKRLREFTTILCDYFLAKVLIRTHAVVEHCNNKKDRRQYFPDGFLSAVGLYNDENDEKFAELYEKKSLWEIELREIKDCFIHGTLSPTNLTIEVISEFWKDANGIEGLNLLDRKKAEDTLFLVNNYREHFVHILKVFLMGERIIAELRSIQYAEETLTKYFSNFDPVPNDIKKRKKCETPDVFQKLEYLWMLASTIHDWSYPIEEISKVLEVYWDKFFFGSVFAKEYFKGGNHGKAVLEAYAQNVFSDHVLGHDASTCFLHMLNDYGNGPHQNQESHIQNITKAYDAYGEDHRNSYNQEIIKYISQKRDHGIASALWYLGLSLQCKKCSPGCKDVYSGHLCGKLEDDDIKKQFVVAHAVYNHNLATKNIKTKIDFEKHPLTFILLLSDVLQDEGRPIGGGSRSIPDRPVGHIEGIQTDQGKLNINVVYKWKLSGDDEETIVTLGSEKCLELLCKKQKICKMENSDKKETYPCSSECEYVINLVDFYDKLPDIMFGLNVGIKAGWKTDAWSKRLATPGGNTSYHKAIKYGYHAITIQEEVKSYMKIALLEPSSDIKGCYVHAGHNEFEPIALGYIASNLEKLGFKVKIFRQGVLSVEQLIDQIKEYYPSILGLSVMTHAAESALNIAKKAKKLIPGIYVIAGGYHPSGDMDFILNSQIDFAVIGEGDRTFSELTTCLLKSENKDFRKIKGIRFVDKGKVISTGSAERISKEELDEMPFPRRSKEIISKTKMHALMYPAPSKQKNVVTLLSSRGCPNNCQFCCSNSVWGRTVVFRDPKLVAEELVAIIDEFGTNAFFFSDLTFNCNKKHVITLCNELIKIKDIPHWYAMCTATNMDEETINAMREAGCRKIGFGVESLAINDLKKVNKSTISVQESTKQSMKYCDENGILTKAYLIIGYPWETHDSLVEFQGNICKLPVDEIRISYFTPFPGSPAYREYKNILTTKDWSKFNAIRDVVVKNKQGVTASQLAETRIDAFKKFYGHQDRHKRISEKIEKFPEFEDSFNEFEIFLREAKVIK